MKKIVMYGIKNCDTVGKAIKWLQQHDIPHFFYDIRSDGLSKKMLEKWLASAKFETILNKKSATWRKLPAEAQEKVSKLKSIDLLLEWPTMIKRPVLDIDGVIHVGFTKDKYAIIFSSKI